MPRMEEIIEQDVYCPRASLSLRRAEFIPLFTERIEIRSTTKLPAGGIDQQIVTRAATPPRQWPTGR
jgi:hypothetical protein